MRNWTIASIHRLAWSFIAPWDVARAAVIHDVLYEALRENKAKFSKKAKGRITFVCNDGHLIDEAIKNTLATGEGQTFWMQSVGKDEAGDIVSTFDFEWTVRVKS